MKGLVKPKTDGHSNLEEVVIIKFKPGRRFRNTWVTVNLPAWLVLLILVSFVVTFLIMAGNSPGLAVGLVAAISQLAKVIQK